MNALIAAVTFYELARMACQSRFVRRNIASRFVGYNLTVVEECYAVSLEEIGGICS
jgi:hypothetical protein